MNGTLLKIIRGSSELINSQIGWIAGLFFIILSIDTQFATYLNQDLAWNIHTAGQMLNGKKLYVDFIDPNPPLLLYWAMIPVAVSRNLGLDIVTASRLVDISAALLCILVISHTLKYTIIGQNRLFNQLFSLTICMVIFILPLCSWANTFFSKDVMTIPFLMPYFLLALGRIEGAARPGKLTLIIVGLMAGFGFCPKPHFILIFVASEMAVLLSRKNIRASLVPETIIIVIFSLVYLSFILLFHYEYITDTLPIVMFTHPLFTNQTNIVMSFFFYMLLPAFASLTLASFFPSCVYKRYFSLILSMFIIVAIIQNKGWGYQLYPSMAMGYILLVKIIVDVVSILSRRKCKGAETSHYVTPMARLKSAVKYIVILLLMGVIIYDGIYTGYKRYVLLYTTDHLGTIYSIEPITGYIDRVKKDRPNVLILSEFLHHTYPAIFYGRGETSFALPFLFTLTAIENFRYEHKNDNPQWVESRIKPIRQFMYQKINDYMVQYKPDVIIARNRGNFHMRREKQDINIIEYLRSDKTFTKLMGDYSQTTTPPANPYDVYYRKQE